MDDCLYSSSFSTFSSETDNNFIRLVNKKISLLQRKNIVENVRTGSKMEVERENQWAVVKRGVGRTVLLTGTYGLHTINYTTRTLNLNRLLSIYYNNLHRNQQFFIAGLADGDAPPLLVRRG